MAFPINGATDAATLTALQSAGLSTALLSEESLELDGSAAAAAVVAVRERAGTRSRLRSRNRMC